jgi:aminopeptidase N
MRIGVNTVAAALALAGLMTAGAHAASPFAVIDAAQGELPKTVVPLYYAIDVAPDAKTMRIAGHETITILVRRATQDVTLNALQTTFGAVSLDGKPARVIVDAKKEQATFAFAAPVPAGKHTLEIAYTATVQKQAQGLFKSEYVDPQGKPAFMFSTQLEATDARRLFPSWDEPAFKAHFHVSLVVPKHWTAVSNTPVVSSMSIGPDAKRVTFDTTPKMSTYLVVLCAGDLENISTTADGVKLSVYATRGKMAQAQYALSVMKDLMPYFDSYYGVHFPIKKLDTIMIPGGFLGAMENWGGITYFEPAVVFNPKTQPKSAEQGVFSIIAHEESHQWNGDLTSFAWWDDVWIAEGFATWMETKAPDHFHPEWNMYIGADNDVFGAMSQDAQLTTHPIYIPIHNDTQAAAVFDSISYTKAGALLRMLEQYVGPATFQATLAHYFRTHSYTAFSAADLWRDLGAKSGKNIAAITHNWVYQPGFPMVNVTASCDGGKRSLALTQQRYLNDAGLATGSTVWSIPLNVQTDAASGHSHPELLNRASATLDGGSCDTPLVLNGDSVGFYRTHYDAQTQAQQRAAFLKLSTADRLSLLNDAQSFAATGHAKIDEYLGYAKADVGDTDPFVAQAVLGEYTTMLAFERGKTGEAALKAYLVAQLKPILPIFGGWDGAGMNDDQLNARNTILELLASCDDPDTIAEGKRRFADLLAHPDAYTPLNRVAVIDVAGYAADAATYQKLFGMAMSATDSGQQIADFLAAFKANDPALAQHSLDASMHLPPEFAPLGPEIVAFVASQHPDLAWKFLNENADKLFGSMSTFERAQAITGTVQAFATLIPADQIQAFLNTHVPPDGAPQVKQAMDNIHTRQTIQDRLLPQLDAYITSQTPH